MEVEKRLVLELGEEEFVALVEELEGKTAPPRLRRNAIIRRILAARLERMLQGSASPHAHAGGEEGKIPAVADPLKTQSPQVQSEEKESENGADAIEAMHSRIAELEGQLSLLKAKNTELTREKEELLATKAEQKAEKPEQSEKGTNFDLNDHQRSVNDRGVSADATNSSTDISYLPSLPRLITLCSRHFLPFLDAHALQSLQMASSSLSRVLTANSLFQKMRVERETRSLRRQLSSAHALTSRFQQLARGFSKDARSSALSRLLSSPTTPDAFEGLEERLKDVLQALVATSQSAVSATEVVDIARDPDSSERTQQQLDLLRVDVERAMPSAFVLSSLLFGLMQSAFKAWGDYRDSVLVRSSLAAELERAVSVQHSKAELRDRLTAKEKELGQLQAFHADQQLVLHGQSLALVRARGELAQTRSDLECAQRKADDSERLCLGLQTSLQAAEGDLLALRERATLAEGRISTVSQLVKTALS